MALNRESPHPQMSLPFLPTFLLLQAKHPPETSKRFVVLATTTERVAERDNQLYTAFTMIENPLQMLQGMRSIWRTDAIEENPFHIRVIRRSKLRGEEIRYYEVLMKKTSQYIYSSYAQLYVYTMTQCHRVLPSSFTRVSRGEDTMKRFHFLENEIRVFRPVVSVATSPPAPPATSTQGSQLPRHVLEGYIDSQISNRMECPILMERITRENVACTPCGHLFHKDGIRQELQRSGKCPTCRMNVGPEQLQTLG